MLLFWLVVCYNVLLISFVPMVEALLLQLIVMVVEDMVMIRMMIHMRKICLVVLVGISKRVHNSTKTNLVMTCLKTSDEIRT